MPYRTDENGLPMVAPTDFAETKQPRRVRVYAISRDEHGRPMVAPTVGTNTEVLRTLPAPALPPLALHGELSP